MNANELADKLEGYGVVYVQFEYRKRAATMLRQQQAEIEALKAGKIRAYDNGVEDGRKPNTNPVKEELTDEEIKFIAYPFESVYTTYDKQTDTDTVHTRFDQLGFARAILRKAQEK